MRAGVPGYGDATAAAALTVALLHRGADPNVRCTIRHMTPLQYGRQQSCVSPLSRPDPGACSYAAFFDCPAVIDALAHTPARVAVDKDAGTPAFAGGTALHIAARLGRVAVVRALLATAACVFCPAQTELRDH